MDLVTQFSHFAAALGIGLLIGLERGWKKRAEQPGRRAAGIRTFAITGLLGGLAGATAQSLGGAGSVAGGLVLGLTFLGYAVIITLFCIEENRAARTFSATTAIAGLLTFALGAYALIGSPTVAGAVAVTAAGLLALRQPMHGWLRKINENELRSVIVLLAMTFIALPVVPGDPVGPFGGVNPREIWIIAIVLAGVSFLGYAAVRYFGFHRGVLIAAAAGALVSSTAVTIANARRAAKGEGETGILAAGVAVATAVSFVRVSAIVAALNPSMLVFVLPPLVAATAAAAAFAVICAYGRRSQDARGRATRFHNPFGFWSVVGLAALLALIVFAGRAANEWFGAAGVLLGSLVLGLAEVDSIVVSVARLAPQSLSLMVAADAVLAAVLSNTVSKVALGVAVGGSDFARRMAILAAACIGSAAGAYWLYTALYPA